MVRASCADTCDLSGLTVSITSPEGEELASAMLVDVEDQPYAEAALVLAAPRDPGDYRYTVALVADEEDADAHAGPIDLAIIVTAHAVRVSAWGAPTAIPAGESFSFKAGFKCACGCSLEGTAYRVRDAEGRELAAGTLGALLPGTDGLYYADVAGQAPAEPGSYGWTVEVLPFEHEGLAHAASSAPVSVRAVDAADCEVTVVAIDERYQTPIGNATVLLHPYRAFTDESGEARLKVKKGTYTLSVSGKKYKAYRVSLAIPGDVRLEAQLSEPPEYDGYPMPEPGNPLGVNPPAPPGPSN